MSKQGRLIKNTLILFVGIVGTKLINFIMLPWLTSWLSVDEYGTVDIFLTIVSMVVPIVTLQLEQAVFRFLIDDRTDEDRKKTVSSSVLLLLLILVVIDIFGGGYLILLHEWLYLLYLVAINLQSIYVMDQQIVRGKGENTIYTTNSIIFAFATMGIAAIMIRFLNFGVTGYVIAYIIANFLAILFMMIKSNFARLIDFHYFNLFKLKLLLRYSIPMIVNNVSWWILNASDKLVLNFFIGATANGIFAAAGKIPGLITSVYSVFQMAWQESTSREQNAEDLDTFYSEVFRSLLTMLSLGVIAILLLSRWIFPILINVKFQEAYEHIPILLMGLFFLCIAQFYGGIFVGLHKSSELGWTSSLAAVINLTIDLSTIRYIGIYAASISTFVAYFMLFLVRAIHTKNVITIKYGKKDIVIISICMIMSLLSTYLFSKWIQIVVLVVIVGIYYLNFKDILASAINGAKRKLKITH